MMINNYNLHMEHALYFNFSHGQIMTDNL